MEDCERELKQVQNVLVDLISWIKVFLVLVQFFFFKSLDCIIIYQCTNLFFIIVVPFNLLTFL